MYYGTHGARGVVTHRFFCSRSSSSSSSSSFARCRPHVLRTVVRNTSMTSEKPAVVVIAPPNADNMKVRCFFFFFANSQQQKKTKKKPKKKNHGCYPYVWLTSHPPTFLSSTPYACPPPLFLFPLSSSSSSHVPPRTSRTYIQGFSSLFSVVSVLLARRHSSTSHE